MSPHNKEAGILQPASGSVTRMKDRLPVLRVSDVEGISVYTTPMALRVVGNPGIKHHCHLSTYYMPAPRVYASISASFSLACTAI